MSTSAPATTTVGERRVSLSRGPALILGTILLAAGLYFISREHYFPKWSNLPGGKAPIDGHAFFGIFGVNGWTGMLTAVAGGLLLFGAAQHHLAKLMSLIVAIALGAAAIIALISGNVLGMAAANHWTQIGWGIAAVILLLNTLLPARHRAIEAPVAAGEAASTRRPAYRNITGRRTGNEAPVAGAGGRPGTGEPVGAGTRRGATAGSAQDGEAGSEV